MGGLKMDTMKIGQQFYNCTQKLQYNINNLKQAFSIESEKQSATLLLIASARNKGVIYNQISNRANKI